MTSSLFSSDTQRVVPTEPKSCSVFSFCSGVECSFAYNPVMPCRIKAGVLGIHLIIDCFLGNQSDKALVVIPAAIEMTSCSLVEVSSWHTFLNDLWFDADQN